ncbi:cytochrome P450 [Amycolatopsis sp. NPDC059021]|uniref:cytochrome P450 n=1 Tax=Amycolatopsis sp. NPDC059021 TaxID=3346704 RepID=UPI00366E3B9F
MSYELPLRYPFPPVHKGTPPGEIAWARKHHPLCPVTLPGGQRLWMITRRDDITQVYTSDRFSRLTPAQPDFRPGHLAEIERQATSSLDAMETGLNPVDLVAAFVTPLSVHLSPGLRRVFSAGAVTLLTHREQLEECLEDETLWPRAAEEVLRHHHSGLLGLPLVVTKTYTFHGITLTPGEVVCAPMLGDLWDPAAFDSPEKFRVRREASPGDSAQNLFLSTIYAALFRRFEKLDLAVSGNDIPWSHDMLIPEPHLIPVVW